MLKLKVPLDTSSLYLQCTVEFNKGLKHLGKSHLIIDNNEWTRLISLFLKSSDFPIVKTTLFSHYNVQITLKDVELPTGFILIEVDERS